MQPAFSTLRRRAGSGARLPRDGFFLADPGYCMRGAAPATMKPLMPRRNGLSAVIVITSLVAPALSSSGDSHGGQVERPSLYADSQSRTAVVGRIEVSRVPLRLAGSRPTGGAAPSAPKAVATLTGGRYVPGSVAQPLWRDSRFERYDSPLASPAGPRAPPAS